MSDPSPLRVWVEAARPRTLPAAIAPVIVATALAYQDGVAYAPAAAACLAFALLVQIGTNFANDYFDFIKGADTAERVGPRRAVAAGLVAPGIMRNAMIAAFIAAFAVGLTLLNFGGWPLLVIGIVSIVCGVAYTGGPYPLAYHGWGDVFVFIFFGLVAVGGTYFVQAGELTRETWWIGAGIGGLAANILAVNNYRDVETDARAGKRTLAVRFGLAFTRVQFAAGHVAAIATVMALLVWRRLGSTEAAALIVIAVTVMILQSRALRRATRPSELIALLGACGRYLAAYAILLAIALVW
ncbi:MAG TPA: 1,4-dihydroxy-2-naphthoate polyprenyltransferase [Candidatus Synoicihabitans sp.]|nr:1,4-dihydroxy-2-naphthoate polyprenyltransferase [Candidatus Synoicihabitans sp.]